MWETQGPDRKARQLPSVCRLDIGAAGPHIPPTLEDSNLEDLHERQQQTAWGAVGDIDTYYLPQGTLITRLQRWLTFQRAVQRRIRI